ncbi:glycosyltransferase family 1 protein [Paenibacillaceae bacterium]|nr:glycosyltransferase family 1 protein [Paenibacillaceae bacterium]
MKILASGMGWIDHTPGGLNRYFADYLKAMHELGHHVKGLMTAGGEGTTVPSYVHEVLDRQGKRGVAARSRAFQQSVRADLREGRPDIFNPHFALYAALVTRNLLPREVPIVTHFHGPWALEGQADVGSPTAVQQLKCRMKREVERLAYRRADHFIVLSSYFKQVLSSHYGISSDKIHIIPGAANEQVFRPAADREAVRASLGLKRTEKVLFCSRRLVRRMGLDRLITAMSQIRNEVPDVALYIAGDGVMREELEQLIRKRQLQDSVSLLGRLPGEELVAWFQAADYCIMPSVTLEGFGLVTVEALACGTPVLGTPYGGTQEILGRLSEELLFQDSAPEAIALKVVDVLNGACRVPSRAECREFVLENYTWQRAAQSVTALFHHAIEERKGRRSI